jgi:Uma2 family endonuclease
MATKVQTSVEEYLRSSFDGADREYLEGEVVERGMGNRDHSCAQWRLGALIWELSKQHAIHGWPEIRVRVSETRFRVIDLAIYAGSEPAESVPSQPPLAAIEILSPDDRMSEVLTKLSDYQQWGVEHIWLIHPESRRLYEFRDGALLERPELALPQFGFSFRIDDILPAGHDAIE